MGAKENTPWAEISRLQIQFHCLIVSLFSPVTFVTPTLLKTMLDDVRSTRWCTQGAYFHDPWANPDAEAFATCLKAAAWRLLLSAASPIVFLIDLASKLSNCCMSRWRPQGSSMMRVETHSDTSCWGLIYVWEVASRVGFPRYRVISKFPFKGNKLRW